MLFGQTYLSCLPICVATNGALDCRSATFWRPFCCDSDALWAPPRKNDDTNNKSNSVTPLFLYSGGYRLSVVSSFFRGGTHKTSLSQQNGRQKVALLQSRAPFVTTQIGSKSARKALCLIFTINKFCTLTRIGSEFSCLKLGHVAKATFGFILPA